MGSSIIRDALSAQQILLGRSVIKDVLSLQKSLLNDSISNKVSNTYKNIIQNYSHLKNTAITETINKYDLAEEKLSDFKISDDAVIIGNDKYQLKILSEIISTIIDESGISDLNVVMSKSFEKVFHLISEIKNSNIRSLIYNTIITIFISALAVICTPLLNEIRETIFISNNKNRC